MEVKDGTCYLLEEPKPVLGLRLLRLRAQGGSPALCVSRLYPPERVREQIGPSSVRVLWLSEQIGPEFQSPKALAGLAKRAEDFLAETGGRGTVFLEGVEFLSLHNGFQAMLMTIEHLIEVVVSSHAVLLVSASPRAFEPRQLALLERFMEVPDVAAWTAELDRGGWSRALDQRD